MYGTQAHDNLPYHTDAEANNKLLIPLSHLNIEKILLNTVKHTLKCIKLCKNSVTLYVCILGCNIYNMQNSRSHRAKMTLYRVDGCVSNAVANMVGYHPRQAWKKCLFPYKPGKISLQQDIFPVCISLSFPSRSQNFSAMSFPSCLFFPGLILGEHRLSCLCQVYLKV